MTGRNLYYVGGVDRDPEGTQRKVLGVLVHSRASSMRRRQIQVEVFGDKFGASQTIKALVALEDRRLVERTYDARTGTGSTKQWRVTKAGVAALRLAEAMDEGQEAS